MFINCSNHPSNTWSDRQITASQEYGEIYDLPFPSIEPDWTADDLRSVVDEYTEKIQALRPAAVFVVGEFSFVFMLIDRLKSIGICVLCSRSRRIAVEERGSDGSITKKSIFQFECYREYEYYDTDAGRVSEK